MQLPLAPKFYDQTDQDYVRRLIERAITTPSTLGGLGGSIGPLTAKLSNAFFADQIGTLDFSGAQFALTNSPTGELNITIAPTVSSAHTWSAVQTFSNTDGILVAGRFRFGHIGTMGVYGIARLTDDSFTVIMGGSDEDPAHGAYIDLSGNLDAGVPGWIIYGTGNVAGAKHDWQLGGVRTMSLDTTGFHPVTVGGVLFGTTALPWGKAYHGPSAFTNARGYLNIRANNATDNSIYLEDSNGSPKQPWAIGLSTGGAFDGIGFYDYGNAVLRFQLLAGADGTVTGFFNGPVGIGSAPNSAYALLVNPILAGGTTQQGIASSPTFNSATTVSGRAITATVATAAASFTLAEGIGLKVFNAAKGASSVITTLYGVKIEDQTQGGTNWAVYTGTNRSHFGGTIEMERWEVSDARGANTIWNIRGFTDGVLYLSRDDHANLVTFQHYGSGGGAVVAGDGTISMGLAVNGGSTALVGTLSNHGFKMMSNNTARWALDTSGNLIADTTSGGYVAFRPGSAADTVKAAGVFLQVADASTASTSEVSIASKTLKANTLNANGNMLDIVVIGSCDTQAGTLKIKLGADEIMSEALTANAIYTVHAHIWRLTGATAWRGEFILTTGSGAATVVHKDTATKTSDLSTDLTFDFRGSVTSGGTLRIRAANVNVYNA